MCLMKNPVLRPEEEYSIRKLKSPGFFTEEHFYNRGWFFEIVLNRFPHDRWAYLEIPMHHLIPYSCKFLPRNMRVAIDNLHWDFLDRLPDYDKIKGDRLTSLTVPEALIVCHIFRIGLDRTDCIVNVCEVEFYLSFRQRLPRITHPAGLPVLKNPVSPDQPVSRVAATGILQAA